jgi:hypothetical protein
LCRTGPHPDHPSAILLDSAGPAENLCITVLSLYLLAVDGFSVRFGLVRFHFSRSTFLARHVGQMGATQPA